MLGRSIHSFIIIYYILEFILNWLKSLKFQIPSSKCVPYPNCVCDTRYDINVNARRKITLKICSFSHSHFLPLSVVFCFCAMWLNQQWRQQQNFLIENCTGGFPWHITSFIHTISHKHAHYNSGSSHKNRQNTKQNSKYLQCVGKILFFFRNFDSILEIKDCFVRGWQFYYWKFWKNDRWMSCRYLIWCTIQWWNIDDILYCVKCSPNSKFQIPEDLKIAWNFILMEILHMSDAYH